MSDILGLMSPEAAERLTIEMARRAGSDKSASAGRSSENRRQDAAAKVQLAWIFNKSLNRQILDSHARSAHAQCMRLRRRSELEPRRLGWNGASGCRWSFGRLAAHCARRVRQCLGQPSWVAHRAGVAGLIFAGAVRADPVKGEATFSASGGFARLVFKLAEDVETEVSTAGSILVIRFAQPVDIPIDKCGRSRARLCRCGAARSRRLGDPAVAGTQGTDQHHDGRRTGVRRSVARHAGTGRRQAFRPK